MMLFILPLLFHMSNLLLRGTEGNTYILESLTFCTAHSLGFSKFECYSKESLSALSALSRTFTAFDLQVFKASKNDDCMYGAAVGSSDIATRRDLVSTTISCIGSISL